MLLLKRFSDILLYSSLFVKRLISLFSLISDSSHIYGQDIVVLPFGTALLSIRGIGKITYTEIIQPLFPVRDSMFMEKALPAFGSFAPVYWSICFLSGTGISVFCPSNHRSVAIVHQFEVQSRSGRLCRESLLDNGKTAVLAYLSGPTLRSMRGGSLA